MNQAHVGKGRLVRLGIGLALVLASCTNEPERAPSHLDRLREDAHEPTTVARQADGRARAVTTAVTVSGSTPEERADAFLSLYGEVLGVSNPSRTTEYRETRPDEDGSGETVIYDGRQDGRRVFGGEVRVHLEGDEVVYASASLPLEGGEPLGTATIGEAEAWAITERALALPGADRLEEAALVAYNPGIFRGTTTASDLVWTLALRGAEHRAYRVFVHAQRGELVGIQSLTEEAFDEETHSLESVDPAERIPSDSWTALIHLAELQYTEEGLVAGVMPSAAATAIHGHTAEVHRYLLMTHARDSLDGAGLKLVSFTDFTDEVNAFWDPYESAMVYHPDVSTLDVAAHELAHGMVSFTADLQYQNQSGALNESIADSFGAFVDGNWTIGESSGIGSIRDMSDPLAHEQPHHMDYFYMPGTGQSCATNRDCGDLYCTGGLCEPPGQYSDYGGVHINSGITNHAIYLASVGGTHTTSGIEVTGIGVEKVRHLVYRALTKYLGPASVFIDYRSAMRRAAIDLRLTGSPVAMTYEECGQVLDAFAAVGIGDEDRDGDCVADGDDVCPCVFNPDQEPEACAGEDACEPIACGECAEGETCSDAGRCVAEEMTPWACTRTDQCPSGEFCFPDGTCWDAFDPLGCGDFSGEIECDLHAPSCAWCDGMGCLPCDRAESCGNDTMVDNCGTPVETCQDLGDDCFVCVLYGCGWCESTGQCSDGSDCDEAVGTDRSFCEPTTDPCSGSMTCDACAQEPGCGWCEGSCISESQGCMGDFARERSACHDCSGYRECGACAVDGFCSWCPGSGCVNDALTTCEGALATADLCPG